MVFKHKIPADVKAYAKFLREEQKMSLCRVAVKCGISSSSVKRITNDCSKQLPKTSGARGRPRKINHQQERYILRELKKLRQSEGTFSISRLMTATGLSKANVTPRTVLNVLHRNGYKYRQTRRKGILTHSDFKKRTAFARKMIKRPSNFCLYILMQSASSTKPIH